MTMMLAAAADASLVLALAIVAAAILRHRSAAVRHCVLAAAIVCALLLPVFEVALPSWHLPLASSPWTTEVVSPGVLARIDSLVDAAPPADAGSGGFRRFDALLVVAWTAGALFVLIRLGRGLVRVKRLARAAEPARDEKLLAVASRIGAAHGMARPVKLLIACQPAPVITWGVRRPRVLLPAGAAAWDAARLHVVLSHELAHVRRRDWAMQMAAAVAQALYWFNPLVWIAGGLLRRESERACDDLVLASGIAGSDYATHLLAVARDARHLRAWPAAAIAQPSSLEGRVRAMLNTTLDRTPASRSVRTAAIVLVTLLTLAIATATLTRPAAAQDGIGTITATVFDQSGGLLPAVAVEALHIDSGRTLEATTDRSGSVALENVATGVYQLTIGRLPGFATVRSRVDVRAGDVVQRNVVLPLGSLEETITIIGPREPGAPAPRSAAPAFRPAREIPPPRAAAAAGGIGGNIRQPMKLVDKKPVFPPELGGSSATVVLQARIGIDGYLVDVKDASQTQPHAAFVESLMAAVGLWEFTPTLLNGAPVDTNITITGRFLTAK
jgi:beta-lactamase regulating signal transducer with metallopeptidase domain